MTPVIFINCSAAPFIDDIISGRKVYETRSRNMLHDLVGRRVLLAETGHGRPVIRCSAKITHSFRVLLPEVWDHFRPVTRIPGGSAYDWTPSTTGKWLYELDNVRPVPAFTPPEGPRHGRVWMEYTEEA